MRLLFVLLFAMMALGCENEPCREPVKLSELNERFRERSDEWIDEADPYPLQLEKVAEKRATLEPLRAKLVREREAHTNEMIDAFIRTPQDVARIHTLINAAQKSSMEYGWKLFDLAFDLHSLFTTEQRTKITDAMSEPPKPFSTPFLARRAIDYVMFKIDADDAQKSAVETSISQTEKKINVMIKAQQKTKLTLLGEWTSKAPRIDLARTTVQKSSDDVTNFVHDLIDESARLSQLFKPEQKAFVFDRLERMKTCSTK